MRAFFKGWRRKVGVVTLLMSLVAVGGWIRSQLVADEIFVRRNSAGIAQALVSVEGSFGAMTANSGEQVANDPEKSLAWPQWEVKQVGRSPNQTLFGNPDVQWNWRWCGFGKCTFGFGSPFIGYALLSFWLIPYWSIVIPLTLISGCLLLSKPRRSTSRKLAEPVPEKVA